MSLFKVVKISAHSPGHKQFEVIDESLFSATKAEQDVCAFSIVLPDSDAKNYKEGDLL